MPYLRVRIATSKSHNDITVKVATMLTNLAVTKLGKSAEAAAVDVGFVSPQQWFIGGKALAQTNYSSFFVEIKITEATNTRDQKAAFVKTVFDGMQQLFGPIAPTSDVVLQDVASEAWGYGGRTQEYRYIAQDNH